MGDVDAAESAEAVVALAHVGALGDTARGGARWTVRLLVAYGLAVLIYVPWVGVLPVAGILVATGLWFAFCAATVVFAYRQRVSPRGFGLLWAVVFSSFGLLWSVASAVGIGSFRGDLVYWLPAALVISMPFFVGAGVATKR
ncbi:MAG: hypothetical protein ACYDH5_10510 [Acidimicrobiales bacterium]